MHEKLEVVDIRTAVTEKVAKIFVCYSKPRITDQGKGQQCLIMLTNHGTKVDKLVRWLSLTQTLHSKSINQSGNIPQLEQSLGFCGLGLLVRLTAPVRRGLPQSVPQIKPRLAEPAVLFYLLLAHQLRQLLNTRQIRGYFRLWRGESGKGYGRLAMAAGQFRTNVLLQCVVKESQCYLGHSQRS